MYVNANEMGKALMALTEKVRELEGRAKKAEERLEAMGGGVVDLGAHLRNVQAETEERLRALGAKVERVQAATPVETKPGA